MTESEIRERGLAYLERARDRPVEARARGRASADTVIAIASQELPGTTRVLNIDVLREAIALETADHLVSEIERLETRERELMGEQIEDRHNLKEAVQALVQAKEALAAAISDLETLKAGYAGLLPVAADE